MTAKKPQPIHPGEVLRKEFIEPMGMGQREFAEKIGLTHTRLNRTVNETPTAGRASVGYFLIQISD